MGVGEAWGKQGGCPAEEKKDVGMGAVQTSSPILLHWS